MFVSSKRSRLLLGSFPSEIVYHHKKDPQDAASLNRTVLESSDKTNPNLTRVLDVNPSLFLAREVQPPFIYLRGDGRLNNTNRTNTSNTFSCSSTFISPLVSFFSFFVVLQDWRLRIHKALGAVRPTSSSQSSPRALTGSLPGKRGFGSTKASAGCPAYHATGRTSFDASCSASPPVSRVHGDVFVCEHMSTCLEIEVSIKIKYGHEGIMIILITATYKEFCHMISHAQVISNSQCQVWFKNFIGN